MKKAKKCKWCGKLIEKKELRKHEENCNLNDGGKSDINYQETENKFFD